LMTLSGQNSQEFAAFGFALRLNTVNYKYKTTTSLL
jgi:hypothetical protein